MTRQLHERNLVDIQHPVLLKIYSILALSLTL